MGSGSCGCARPPTPAARPSRTGIVSIAVIGVGYWGPNVVRCLREIESASVATICDVNGDALTIISRRYPGIPTTNAFEDVLDNEAIDAVVIATPVSTHYELATAALRAGKHVLVEKPLAGSSAHAAELVELARSEELVLMTGHTFLYSPPVNLIETLISSGALGETYFVSTSRVSLGLHRSDVSVVWDLAPHDFSILCYWLNETPTHVSALGRSCVPGHVDVAFVNMEFASGRIAHAELSWMAPSKVRRASIVGSEKMIAYDDRSAEPVRIFDSVVTITEQPQRGGDAVSYRKGEIVSPPVDPTEPLLLELDDFCRSIKAGVPPRSNGQIGLDVVRMVEATECSRMRGGERVPVTGVSTHPSADLGMDLAAKLDSIPKRVGRTVV